MSRRSSSHSRSRKSGRPCTRNRCGCPRCNRRQCPPTLLLAASCPVYPRKSSGGACRSQRQSRTDVRPKAMRSPVECGRSFSSRTGRHPQSPNTHFARGRQAAARRRDWRGTGPAPWRPGPETRPPPPSTRRCPHSLWRTAAGWLSWVPPAETPQRTRPPHHPPNMQAASLQSPSRPRSNTTGPLRPSPGPTFRRPPQIGFQ
mmetsp:Transcript_103781/g.332550  ORF Transcript_103781/g.332550 Transcript_103781/m.332550 type:complete len:202 (-) Transcript_103781:1455-2060(-)